MLHTHAPAIRLVNVFILMRFPPSTLIRWVCVFDENAQHMVWAENLYTSKCMDFQMKTHFGPLHHGPKAHFYQIFHSKTAKTKSMHNWGKKKKDLTSENIMKCWPKTPLCPFQAYFELLWIVLISFSLKFGKVSWINATFLILQTKKDSNLQLCYVRIQAQLPNLPVFQTVPGRSGAAVFTSVCCWGIYYA